MKLSQKCSSTSKTKRTHTEPLPDGAFLRHEPCPKCSSSDALAVYDNGSGYCFACSSYFPDLLSPGPITHTRTMSTVTVQGSAAPLRRRGISQATCEKFKCYTDGDKLRFYYYENGVPVGCKTKTKSKEFRYEGKATQSLYGMHLFPTSGKRVVITEGEVDALSYAEVQPSWPVVSLPSGAAAARKALQANLEWLQGYEEIVIAFDNDEAGREATEDAVEVLPAGKVKLAALPDKYKDFSDALQADDIDAIKRAVWDAKPYTPAGILNAKELLTTLLIEEPPSVHDYKFQGIQSKLHGIRHRELITIAGGTGIGKSSFCRQLACDVLQDGGRVGYLALEEHYRRTLLGLIGTAKQKCYTLTGYTTDEMMEAYDDTVAKWELHLFDGFGSFDPDSIYKKIEYMVLGLDCKIIFLDHLSILLSGLADIDERRTIDIVMTQLRALVERTGMTLFLLCHVSGDDNGKPYEEGGRIKLNKLRGSRSIGQLSDVVIGLERNQQDEQHGHRTTVRILKNRFSGEVGPACNLDYDTLTCTYRESSYSAPVATSEEPIEF